MNAVRGLHTATLLPSGKVLIAGGWIVGLSATNILAVCRPYDPASGIWTPTGSMSVGRFLHAACLLPNGKVLVSGGMTNSNFAQTWSAEIYDPASGTWTPTASTPQITSGHSMIVLPNGKVLTAPVGGFGVCFYDPGLSISNAWQPQITSVTSPLAIGGSLTVNGSGFGQIIGNQSGPDGQGTSTDYPLVQLRSIESGQTTFLLATNWSANSFTSLPVTNFPPGYALATVFAGGIPSTSSMVNISVPVATPPVLSSAGLALNGAFQFGFTNSPGALFGVWATTSTATKLTNWTALGVLTEASVGAVSVQRCAGDKWRPTVLQRAGAVGSH